MFLRSQKNSIYAAISKHSLNLRDFHLAESTELKLIHIPSDYYYRIQPTEVLVTASNTKENRLESLFIPNFRAPIPTVTEARLPSAKTWNDLLGFLDLWLTWLKSEVEQPDLWAEIEQKPDIIIEDAEIVDDLFTPAEIKLLQERIITVESQVIALDLPQQAEIEIVKVLREMPAKAKRLTKKELWEVLFGTIVRESLKAGLTAEHTSNIIKTRYQLFHSPI